MKKWEYAPPFVSPLRCLFSTRVAVKFALNVGRLRYCAVTKDSGHLCYFKKQEDAKPAGHCSLLCWPATASRWLCFE